MFNGSWGAAATGSAGSWGSGGGGSVGSVGTWGASSGGGGGTWGGATTGGGGAVLTNAPASLPGGVGLPGFSDRGYTVGPYGEGVYTPLKYPAMRFLDEGQGVDDSRTGSLPVSVKTLLIGALLLWALK